MHTFERPGIDQRWEKSWEMHCRFVAEMAAEETSDFINDLDNFAICGNTIVQPMEPLSQIDPPRQAWENSFLRNKLAQYTQARLWAFEKRGIEENAWLSSIGVHAFAAAYTEQMSRLSWHMMFPLRFHGRFLRMLHVDSVRFSAFGLVLGCKSRALDLARMQLAAHRRQDFTDAYLYPVFHFMFRLFADFLGEPAPLTSGEGWSEPLVNALYDVWRTPDVAVLAPLCIAVCDIHTMRSQPPGPGKTFFEFGDMKRLPIEILLLFKLRQLLGLENPVLDHPLMTTALGQLPVDVDFQPDDLISRVRARMVQEGYDEQAIVEMCTRA